MYNSYVMSTQRIALRVSFGLLATLVTLPALLTAASAGESPRNNPSILEDRKRRLDLDIELYEQSTVPHVFTQVANMKNDSEDSAQYEMVFSDWTFGSVLEDQEESSGLKTKEKSTLTPGNWSSIRNAGDWRVNSQR